MAVTVATPEGDTYDFPEATGWVVGREGHVSVGSQEKAYAVFPRGYWAAAYTTNPTK